MFYRRLFNVPTRGFNWAFQDFDRFRRQLDDIYGALSGGALQRPSAGVFPLINLTENKENYYVRAELPGINSADLDIQVTGEGISIAGERKIPVEENDVKYHRRERESGRFSRVINFPGEVNVDSVKATVTDGVLTVTIPKAEAAKPRQIKVT